MSSEAARSARLSSFEQLRYARQILHLESRILAQLAKRLNREFCKAVEHRYRCQGGTP
jgi:D-arabinose 5-phosphate isomerase GutQ